MHRKACTLVLVSSFYYLYFKAMIKIASIEFLLKQLDFKAKLSAFVSNENILDLYFLKRGTSNSN